MNLTRKEKIILYNFVVGESNRIFHPDMGIIKKDTPDLSVEAQIKLSITNLNNFDSDVEKYEKCLLKLIKKLKK